MTREEAIRIIKIVLAVSADFEIIVQGEEMTEEKCKEAVEIVTKALIQEPCEDCISRSSIKQKLQEHHDFFVKAYGGFSNLPQNDKSRVDEITNCIAMVVNEPSVHTECTEDYCPAAFMPTMIYPQVEGITPTVVEHNTDCISRQDAIDEFRGGTEGYDFANWCRIDIIEVLEALPSVTPAEKFGHWEQFGNSWEDKFKCSECGKEQPKILCGERIIGHWSDYCPNCGAKMQEVEDD